MIGAGQPAGKLEASALIRWELRFRFEGCLRDLDEAACDGPAQREMTAADVDGQFFEDLR